MTDITFREITSRIKTLEMEDFDLVIGVGRGGIVPAALLAYKLDRPLYAVKVSYRDESNKPMFGEPRVDARGLKDFECKKILLVDDVSVTGSSLNAVKQLLKGVDVKTLVLKGSADHVLFPEIKECVNWPWR